MFDLSEIRAGLAAQMAALGQTLELIVSPYMLASPNSPGIEVMGPDEITYDVANQRGGDSVTMIVRAFTGLVSAELAQINLDKLIDTSGANSMKAALEQKGVGEHTVTLGGACDDLRVIKCSGYMVYPRSGGEAFLGAEWVVQVETTG